MSVILETGRLLLRPPRAADISHFVPLLKDFDVAKNLSRVPHPYTEDDACAFVVSAAHGWRSGEDLAFGILRKSPSAYIGICGVHPARSWEFGYWLGKPYWGQGYATEAAGRLIAFAFDQLRGGCWPSSAACPTAKRSVPASRAGLTCSVIRSC